MDTLRYDLRHAIRAMGRQPVTSLIVVMTLALAIGANTAVFSAVHTVLIRPLPYAQPDSLVMVWEKREAEGVMNNSVSAADYLDWSRMAQSFTAMAAFTEVTADLTGEGDPEKFPHGGGVIAVLRGAWCAADARSHVRGRRRYVRPQSRRGARSRHLASTIRRRRRPSLAVRSCSTAIRIRSSACCRPTRRFHIPRRSCFRRSCCLLRTSRRHERRTTSACMRGSARRVVRAGARGNGSDRQGSGEDLSATEPRPRLARDVAARRDHRPRRAHAGGADGGGRPSSC